MFITITNMKKGMAFVQVIGFASSDDLDDYLLQNPQTVQAAVNFEIESTNIGYNLQTNATVSRKTITILQQIALVFFFPSLCR